MDTDELWIGELIGVEVNGCKLALANVDGRIRAFEDRCPHLGAQLSDGVLEGCNLTCAKHRWEFDVDAGVGVNPSGTGLTVFETRVVDGHIEVALPETTRQSTNAA